MCVIQIDNLKRNIISPLLNITRFIFLYYNPAYMGKYFLYYYDIKYTFFYSINIQINKNFPLF